MERLKDAIHNLFLAAIIGLVSKGVSFAGEISKNLQELNLKMAQMIDVTSDHEARIRQIEKIIRK